MKLACVEHTRCREYDATTYVWVADDMTKQELQSFCAQAAGKYLTAEKELQDAPTPYVHPGYLPDFERYPNKTVAEVKAEHAKQLAAYNHWHEKSEASRKTFAYYLAEISSGRIMEFYAITPDLQVGVNWGCNHGVVIDYGKTDVTAKDLNAPLPDDSSL
jgi:hypothetical protein